MSDQPNENAFQRVIRLSWQALDIERATVSPEWDNYAYSSERATEWQAGQLASKGILYGKAGHPASMTAQDIARASHSPASMVVWGIDEKKRKPATTLAEHEDFTGKRYCPACNQDKPLHKDYWHRNEVGRLGFRTDMCKVCRDIDESQKRRQERGSTRFNKRRRK